MVADPRRDWDPNRGRDPRESELQSLEQYFSKAFPSPDLEARSTAVAPSATESAPPGPFFPAEPASLEAAGLTESEVEALILKYFLHRGDGDGRSLSTQVKLPFGLVDRVMRRMKDARLVTFADSALIGDFRYRPTEAGLERARGLASRGTYFGAAPVPLADYVASVAAQSLREQHPREVDLRRALRDLTIEQSLLDQLGPAVNSGRALLLYGAAGNGKTSIAERVTRAFGRHIWIPRAIHIDGEIMRLFDPINHVEVPPEDSDAPQKYDKRWVRIERPTIVVGGELTAEHLEVTMNTSAGVSEAPLQVKSNCGTFVVDDLGRQRISTEELLNRWIVPLEKRVDYLTMPSGKKIQVPFDELVIFSTNLDPTDVAHEAFLRRIPYKIGIPDPNEAEFRALAQRACDQLGFDFDAAAIDHLIETHYRPHGRPFRRCEPRDLLTHVRSYCDYRGTQQRLTPEYLDIAAACYFV